MPITSSIPNTLRVPWAFIEFDGSRANQGATQQQFKQLILGHRLSSGEHPVDANGITAPIRITSSGEAAVLFGVGSMLHGMIQTLIANNRFTETWVVGVDEPSGGTAAVKSLTFAGTATASGTISLYVMGRKFQVPVTSGDTASVVATATVAAVAGGHIDLCATAAVNGGVPEQVDFTFRHKGALGSEMDIRIGYYDSELMPKGITATVAEETAGAGTVDLTDVWAILGDEQYHVIACPWNDDTAFAALDTELADRWGPLRQNDGLACLAHSGNHSTVGTYGDGKNSKHAMVMSTYGSPTPIWEWSAGLAGVVAYHGNIDPGRPFQTLRVNGVLAPQLADRFDLTERNLLLYGGIATHVIGAGGTVHIERAITTYQETPLGADDTAFLDVNTLLTLSYLRYDFRNAFLTEFARHKLRDDSQRLPVGQAIMTPGFGKAWAIGRFSIWESLGLVEGIEQFKRDIIVERNLSDPNRLDFLLPPDLVNQLRVAGVKIQFLL